MYYSKLPLKKPETRMYSKTIEATGHVFIYVIMPFNKGLLFGLRRYLPPPFGLIGPSTDT